MTASRQAFEDWQVKQGEDSIPPRERAMLRVISQVMRQALAQERAARLVETSELRGMVRKLQLEVARLKVKP